VRDLASFRFALQHKLRTPVAHIAMSATLLALAQAPGNLPPEVAEYVEIVQDAAAQLGKQIDELLAYSNPVPDPGHASNATLAEVEQIVQSLAADSRIKQFTWQPCTAADQRSVPLSLRALEVILIELYENACKFHPQQAPHVRVKLIEEGDHSILLRCEDDGLTLAPTQLERIWRPFFQAEAGFSGNVPGSGLGLPLIAALVIGVGGQVRFYNRNPGPGVAVELTIPLVEQSAPTAGG
jgi:signal transduction histidine kinase